MLLYTEEQLDEAFEAYLDRGTVINKEFFRELIEETPDFFFELLGEVS